MKTARITLLVEYQDEPPKLAFFNHPRQFDEPLGGWRPDHGAKAGSCEIEPLSSCQIIGTPTVEVDKRHRCSMSESQYQAALKGIRARGGNFAMHLTTLLAYADSVNRAKLLETFHDLIWAYVPGDTSTPDVMTNTAQTPALSALDQQRVDRIVNIVSEQLGVHKRDVKLTSSFIADLGADSLDQVELVMALEDEYDIQITDEDGAAITTVQQAVDYIERRGL